MSKFIEFLKSESDQIFLSDIGVFIKDYNIKVDLFFTLIDLIYSTVFYNKEILFERLIDYVPDINQYDNCSGKSLIMTAALFGRIKMIKILLNKGASIEYKEKNSLNTLRSALQFVFENPNITCNQIECAEELIKAGANISVLKNECHNGYQICQFLKNKIDNNKSQQKDSNQSKAYSNIVKLLPYTNQVSSKNFALLIEDADIEYIDSNGHVCTGKLNAGIYIELPSTNLALFHELPINAIVNNYLITKHTQCQFVNHVVVKLNGIRTVIENAYRYQNKN